MFKKSLLKLKLQFLKIGILSLFLFTVKSAIGGELYWPLNCTPGDQQCYSYLGYPDIDQDGVAFNCDNPGYTGHEGTDISVSRSAMQAGMDVTAAADGEVLWVFDGKFDDCPSDHPDCQPPVPGQSDGYSVCSDTGWCFYGGNVVVLKHPTTNNIYGTRYDHLKKNSIIVQPGQLVKAGEKIAEAASAGASTGPHLHFEVWANEVYDLVDPWAGRCGTNTGSTLWKYNTPWVAKPLALPDGEWALISLPATLPSTENTVAAVFGDDMAGTYATDWIVYSFDSASQQYFNLGLQGTLESGTGYWITHSNGQTVDIDLPASSSITLAGSYAGCVTSPCFRHTPVTTGTTQWHLAGNPYRGTVASDKIKISTTNMGTCANGCTIAEAATKGLVDDIWYVYNSGAYESVTSRGAVDGWSGFWMATKASAESSGMSVLMSADGT